MSEGAINVLLVDDKPANLLALTTVLRELGENLVCASTGREALRCLLQQEFAVILLDVNMPGMDGFETATLIRQRPSSAHTPIIFITAHADAEYLSRGYELGAVDYILTPVVPEVLKTKVAVFVDLFRKTEQVRRQAQSLQHRADQLRKLAATSLGINSADSIDRMLEVATEAARDIAGAHQAATVLVQPSPAENKIVLSASDRYDQLELAAGLAESELVASVCHANKPLRLSKRELQDGFWAGQDSSSYVPGGACLIAPLTGRHGHNVGFVILSEKVDGDFTADDEMIVAQLGQKVAIAVENLIYAREREANRIKEEFLSTLSHELRTPLNAILGWTQLLRMEKLPSDAMHGIEVIERNAKSQARLVEDLLDVSRISSGKFRLNCRPVSLRPIVTAAIDAVRLSAADKRIELECSIDGADQVVFGDPDRIQQVLWNLLTNAIKFTPAGGRVELGAVHVNGSVQIRVSDTGRGINPAFLPSIFGRFRQDDTTSKRNNTGLGLGLAITKHIVDLHGGTIRAESPGLNLGATFTVLLPISQAAPADAAAGPAEGASEPSADLRGLTVLIVEDNDDARDMVCNALRRAHADVRAADSVPKALSLFGSLRPDVIVSDIAMPGQDGYDLIHQIRQLSPGAGGNTPAIALTAYAHQDDRLRALAAGFQMHLAKPVKPAELVVAVAHLASEPARSAPEGEGSHAIAAAPDRGAVHFG